MDWDMNIDEHFPADVHTQLPEERTIVPVGTHVATIKKAEEGPNQWKVDDANPDGICLKLRLSIGQHKFVFHDLPKHLPWMAKQLADALGIVPEGNTLRVVPEDIEGREVTVEIVHYTSKSGKVSAVVKKYVPMQPSQRHRSVRRCRRRLMRRSKRRLAAMTSRSSGWWHWSPA